MLCTSLASREMEDGAVKDLLKEESLLTLSMVDKTFVLFKLTAYSTIFLIICLGTPRIKKKDFEVSAHNQSLKSGKTSIELVC